MNDHEFDELALLRSIRGRDSDPTEAEEARGLAALERGIAAQQTGRARSRAPRFSWRRRGALWGAIGVVAVGSLLGVTIVVAPGTVLSPVVTRDPDAHAVELLERSAREIPELVVGEGQYLRWEYQFQQVTTHPALGDTGAVTYRTLDKRARYIPADPRAPQTFRSAKGLPSDIIFPVVDASEQERLLEQLTEGYSAEVTSEQYLEGSLPVSAAGGAEAEAAVAELEAAQLRRRSAPLDSAGLRAFLLAEAEPGVIGLDGREPTEDELVLREIFATIQDQTAPSELRAACLSLLAEMPGITAEPYRPPSGIRASDGLLIEGGTVVTSAELRGDAFQMIFDEETATLLGTQVVLTEESPFYEGAPAGTVVLLQTFESSVVDHVPETEAW